VVVFGISGVETFGCSYQSVNTVVYKSRIATLHEAQIEFYHFYQNRVVERLVSCMS
jgi:hypothetical protein